MPDLGLYGEHGTEAAPVIRSLKRPPAVRTHALEASTENEAVWTICALVQLYREQAWYLERIYKWMDRVGLDWIKPQIEDPESRRALYDRFAFSQRVFRIDPWAERVAGRDSHEFNPLSRRLEFA